MKRLTLKQYQKQWKPDEKRIAKLKRDYQKAAAEGHFVLMVILQNSIRDAQRPPYRLPEEENSKRSKRK